MKEKPRYYKVTDDRFSGYSKGEIVRFLHMTESDVFMVMISSDGLKQVISSKEVMKLYATKDEIKEMGATGDSVLFWE